MYLVSYIIESGVLVLNNTIKAPTMGEALFELRQAEEIKVILSIIAL